MGVGVAEGVVGFHPVGVTRSDGVTGSEPVTVGWADGVGGRVEVGKRVGVGGRLREVVRSRDWEGLPCTETVCRADTDADVEMVSE